MCAALAAFLPFVTLKANRLLAGTALGWAELPSVYWILVPMLLVVSPFVWARHQARGLCLFVLGQALLIALLALLSSTASLLGQDPISRVSPAAGFWLWLLGAGLIAYAGALEMRRLWLASSSALLLLGFLLFGAFGSLSVLREYAANQSEFWQESLTHIRLALAAWGFSSLIGGLLGVYAATRPSIARWLLGIANALQTIPSIALFALLIPFYSALTRAVPFLETIGIRGIGAAPALSALTLYGLLPVLRGVIVGLMGVPEAPLEAAKGLGLTPNQLFWQVRLPLAMPLLLEGLRLAAVSLIGLTALSSLIGAGGLGGFIFTGLGSGAIDRVLLGAIPTLGLALLVHFGLRGLEAGLTPRGLR